MALVNSGIKIQLSAQECHPEMTTKVITYMVCDPVACEMILVNTALGCLQTGNADDIAKYSKRTVRVTQQHNDECKRLLTLMGVPIVNVSYSTLLRHPCVSSTVNQT